VGLPPKFTASGFKFGIPKKPYFKTTFLKLRGVLENLLLLLLLHKQKFVNQGTCKYKIVNFSVISHRELKESK